MANISKYIKQYTQDFIGNGIYDIIKFISQIIMTTIIGTGIVYEVSNIFFDNIFLIVIICFTTVLILCVIFIGVYKHIRKYKFRIISMDVNFEYLQDKVIVISKIHVKSLRKGLDRIYNRTTWFPDEKTRISCLEKEFSIERLPQKDTSHEYNVVFNRKLKKGEKITFTTKVINENKKRHFKNFYAREIITPLNELKITVVIPSKYGYKYLVKEINKGSAYNDFSDKDEIEFTNTYTWEIDPQLGYEYKLLWKKNKGI